jgi:hypothetical protein
VKFLVNLKGSPYCWATFSTVKGKHYFSLKVCRANLGYFFTNSSDHSNGR